MRELLASSRLPAAALVLVCSSCKPDLPETPTDTVVTAVFDPTTAQIPLPNDLALPPFNTNINAVCGAAAGAPACAQAELLAAFASGGGFPNDQEVAITIGFTQTDFHANGVTTTTAPELDLASLNTNTVFVVSLTGAVAPELDPFKATDYVKATDHGTLSIHNKDRKPWPPGRYAILMRSGASGVKTVDGTPVNPSQIFYLIAQGKDLTDPANIGLLRAQLGSTEEAIAQGQQLNMLIALYKNGQNSVFALTDAHFPHEELAIAATFSISGKTNITVDAARGIVPLPIDLLRDPAGGHLTPLAACTLAGAELNPDGTCPSAAAGGFQALDGFSTTGAIIAPTSDVILAATARTPGAVRLFDLSTTPPSEVPATTYITEPCEFTVNPANGQSGCTNVNGAVSTVVAIQPAGATTGEVGGGVFRTKPLKDKTDYAVVITNDVHDRNNAPIAQGTVASILRFTNPIVKDGKSQLLGVDDGTAAALDKMRLQLQPVIAALPAADRAKVAMAYTFRTQTILDQAVQLAALPYSPNVKTPASAVPVGAVTHDQNAGEAFTRWGVDPAQVPLSHIDRVIEADIETLNALDPITGAFMPDPLSAAKEKIHVMIATPSPGAPNLADCLGAGQPKCAPMMIFRHGLGSGRAAMLAVADTFAAAGMVTVAIDAAKHGDRSFCTSGPASATSGCNGGAECKTLLPPGAQGDVHPPGSCDTGFVKRPVSSTCTTTPCWSGEDGIPAVSGNYLTSSNLFRTRDTLRQDLIDQSQLIRALVFVPGGATSSTVFTAMAGHGVVINPNPGFIYFTGQSLGAIQGTVDVAANPRITKAAFNVGGGTLVDVLTQSKDPKLQAAVGALLTALHITPGSAEFLQFLIVAKTVLDPADPINFAGHLTDHTLPNLLAPTPSLQQPKKVLVQIANCDLVVPNPFNLIDASNVYAGNDPVVPLPAVPEFFLTPSLTGAFQLFIGPGFANFGSCPEPPPAPQPSPTPVVAHGFLTDWAITSLTTNAQTDIASFMTQDGFLPFVVRHQ